MITALITNDFSNPKKASIWLHPNSDEEIIDAFPDNIQSWTKLAGPIDSDSANEIYSTLVNFLSSQGIEINEEYGVL